MEKEALFDIGDRSYRLFDFTNAETYLEKAISLNPNFEQALQHLIWTYRDQGRYDRMRQVAEQYLARQPQSVQAYVELAGAAALQGDLDKAQETLTRAEQLFPKEYQPAYLSGLVCLSRDQFAEAEAEFRKLLRPSGSSKSKFHGYDGLAVRDLYLGHYQEAIENFDQEQELIAIESPQHATIMNPLKALCIVASGGNPEKAIQIAADLTSATGRVAALYYEYAFYLDLTVGEPQKAAALYKQQLGFYPFGPPLVRAYQHKAQGAHDEAIRSFLKGTQNFTSNSMTYFAYDLARCYMEAGKSQEAIRTLKKFQNRYVLYAPFIYGRALYYPKSFYLLGKIYESTGEKDQAVESYQKFLELLKNANPELPELVESKARMKDLTKDLKKKKK